MSKNLLLLSSSRVGNTKYLQHAKEMINNHLGEIRELVFIPFAGVTVDYDKYTEMVQSALAELNIKVVGLHTFEDQVSAINNAEAVAIGGGNTFHLLHQLYENDLFEPIRRRTSEGMPYIGWSAGSNVAGSTIRTTNDMPIIQPKSFDALGLIPVQLNPHYTDYNPPGHNGETREQRLAEFMVLNPTTYIAAIVEGTALKVEGNKMTLIGGEQGYLFLNGQKDIIEAGADISFLIND
ncbi:dipeptidase PepE [Thalassotalea nanhaiensis]|uniref:Dipeptidase PepE n=1 Tax=Thalassotalea nanhaiensis TaxID=3065648 RepID=A0ABY9TD14_9GAMM|nr:dipeptidase PepE [Colwelliaceae bacterium SQ345]